MTREEKPFRVGSDKNGWIVLTYGGDPVSKRMAKQVMREYGHQGSIDFLMIRDEVLADYGIAWECVEDVKHRQELRGVQDA